jgi:ankyrin repeat protein
MQAIDIATSNSTSTTNNSESASATNASTILPSPPSSPIGSQPPKATTAVNSRKRAYSLSFIQNEPTDTTTTNQQTNIKRHKFDLGCLQTYLSQKGSPNTCDAQFKRSLLCWACIGQSVEGVKDLTSMVHLDINLKSGPNNTTALHEACLIGFKEGVELLIQHPDIDVNAVDNRGQTAIHFATQSNKVECLKILLSAGARIDLFSNQGRLPIHTAIQFGFQHCVSLLLSKSKRHDNNPTETDLLWKSNLVDERCSIESSIITGYINTLQLLLDHDRENLHQKKSGLVQLAVEWNRIECLHLLIKRGCIIDESSLLTAVKQRKIDMVRELSQAGANPCLKNGQNPSFLYAANHGFLDMIPLVLTLSTSKDCIQQALLLASCLGLRDKVASVIIQTLKSKQQQATATPTTTTVP